MPAARELGEQVACGLRHVAEHREVDGVVRAQRLGVNIDLRDRRAGAEQAPVSRGPHRQRRPEGQHEVGVGDQLGGGGEAKPPEMPRSHGLPREQPRGDGRGRQQRPGGVGELLQQVTGVRQRGPASGEDDRAGGRASASASASTAAAAGRAGAAAATAGTAAVPHSRPGCPGA